MPHVFVCLCALLLPLCGFWQAAQAPPSSPTPPPVRFRPLFDGTTLTGWVGDTAGYSVVDGAIEAGASGTNLFSAATFADFHLKFEFQLTPGANNGIGIRAPLEGDAAYEGMEIQVLDNSSSKYASLAPWQYHGSIYGVVPAKREHLKPVGEWNHEEIIVDGSKVRVILNGTPIVDADVSKAAHDGTPDGKPHPGLRRQAGHIGFLGHGDRVRFRKIEIAELH